MQHVNRWQVDEGYFVTHFDAPHDICPDTR
jgi:hypothetical protein